jgi:hypothetical protein
MKTSLSLLAFYCVFSCHIVLAQSSVTFDGSQVFSTFKFIDSKGNLNNNFSQKISGAYSLGYFFQSKKGFTTRASIGMRKGGASYSFSGTNIIWNLQYVDVKAGVGYTFGKKRFRPYVTASAYYAKLLNANQEIDNQNFDIIKTNSIKNLDFGFLITPGIKLNISDYLALYSEFNYLIGLQNLETNTNQKSFSRGSSISLGVAATITKITPKWLK